MRIKKGDQVKIIVGKDKGKTGKVSKTFKDAGKIIVEGLNLYKKRVKPKGQNQKGEIVSMPRPLQVSNAMLVCPSCKKPTRVGFKIEADNKKIRICKKCGSSV